MHFVDRLNTVEQEALMHFVDRLNTVEQEALMHFVECQRRFNLQMMLGAP